MRREQSTMIQGQAYGGTSNYSPALFRGKVAKVLHADLNPTKQTLVDLFMYDSLPLLYSVPVMASKIGAHNGEHASPEVGDIVCVGFLSGRMQDPVVIGYLPIPNSIQATEEEAPHYKRVQNGTSERIDKDGNRIIHVAKNDTVSIVGDGSVKIGGTLNITVTGNATITAPTVTVSADKVTLDTPLTECTGNLKVTGNITAGGNVADAGGSKTMSGMRNTFNDHIHVAPHDAGTTTTPAQGM